ncbi:diguanylate cyclase (GGDEF)-like protein [Pseudoduganella flava]|uniref:diguanylate cyclase n=1 Tax=Pseudoduganella flava TaxID=871742 RepID=A0A562PZP5_9BURK|nr:diguanylate cyclase [Pseudoduganella flava]QGZ38582.1 diguanylate cyclase [Pseudoduganella flava]TWI49853.1 diguanylate cyclase (GGDEF)-like protein [Pseudoduganella flava]
MNSLQKVLVADDDAINREVLAELLKPEYTVLLAKDGAQALERAARHVPDLILLDVMMPDMDGFEVLRRLRDDPRTADVAVIFVSGMGRPEDEANGLKAGASDYIAKPFNATVVMARVALHLQMVRQRRMLERLAHVDGLTELANRRRFDEVFEQEYQRARRQGTPLSLALLDIDSFKQYNDHYGHPAGDRALRAVARLTAAGMRGPSDLAARYGGEELVLVLPDTDAGQAQALMADMRAGLDRMAIEHVASPVAPVLTVSVGGATLCPGEDPAELFAAADAHLYRAKQAGRNRVMWRAGA